MSSPHPSDPGKLSKQEGIDLPGFISADDAASLPCYGRTLLDSDQRLAGFPNHRRDLGRFHDFETYVASLEDNPYDTRTSIAPCTLRYDTINSSGKLHPKRALLTYAWSRVLHGFQLHVAGEYRPNLGSTPFSAAGCIVFAHNLLPPAIEHLTCNFHLDSLFVKHHIGNTWEPYDKDESVLPRPFAVGSPTVPVLPSRSSLSTVYQSQSSLQFTIKLPRIFDFNSKLSERGATAAEPFQHHGFIFLESVYGQRRAGTVYSLEQISVQVVEIPGNQWRAIVLFPTMRAKRHYICVEPLTEANLQQHRDHAEKLGESAAQRNTPLNEPISLCLALFEYSQAYWDTFLEIVDRLMAWIETPSFTQERQYKDLFLAQNVNLAILKSLLVIEEMLERLDKLHEIGLKGKLSVFTWSPLHSDHLDRLVNKYKFLELRLRRHLPIVQHQVGVLLSRQQAESTKKQIEESQKAIEQANSVKRLTALAFVFIPISTVGTLFGMNVQELSAKEPPLWLFGVVTTCVLVTTLTIALWNRFGKRLFWILCALRPAIFDILRGR